MVIIMVIISVSWRNFEKIAPENDEIEMFKWFWDISRGLEFETRGKKPHPPNMLQNLQNHMKNLYLVIFWWDLKKIFFLNTQNYPRNHSKSIGNDLGGWKIAWKVFFLVFSLFWYTGSQGCIDNTSFLGDTFDPNSRNSQPIAKFCRQKFGCQAPELCW